jgi:hypothetical protein
MKPTTLIEFARQAGRLLGRAVDDLMAPDPEPWPTLADRVKAADLIERGLAAHLDREPEPVDPWSRPWPIPADVDPTECQVCGKGVHPDSFHRYAPMGDLR